jgi:hypothetical protein
MIASISRRSRHSDVYFTIEAESFAATMATLEAAIGLA